MSNFFYIVYQSYAPSGGISPASEVRYATLEEAQDVADAMQRDPGKRPASSGLPQDYAYTHDWGGDGKTITYPQFWPQAMMETGNGIMWRIILP